LRPREVTRMPLRENTIYRVAAGRLLNDIQISHAFQTGLSS
jgi:hypothetical protein